MELYEPKYTDRSRPKSRPAPVCGRLRLTGPDVMHCCRGLIESNRYNYVLLVLCTMLALCTVLNLFLSRQTAKGTDCATAARFVYGLSDCGRVCILPEGPAAHLYLVLIPCRSYENKRDFAGALIGTRPASATKHSKNRPAASAGVVFKSHVMHCYPATYLPGVDAGTTKA